MLQIRKDYLIFKLPGFALVAFALACVVTGASASASAQTRSSRGAAARPSAVEEPKREDEPLFSEYKGVRIGMLADEARKKLGDPQDKSDEQDFFVFNEQESAQVFYDKSRKTYAISVNYLGTNGSTPVAKTVFGSDIEAKPDGSMFKMVRYPKAGFWVSYSRTSGNDPIVSITIQRID